MLLELFSLALFGEEQLREKRNANKGGVTTMNTIREQKAAAVAELKERFQSSHSVVFMDYRGMNVSTVTKLRRKCREGGVEMKVIKNTLARLAAEELGLGSINSKLEGTTAAFYGLTDPVAPAKILEDFLKESKMNLEYKGGIVGGKVIDAAGIKALASLPDKNVLIAQVLGTLIAPITGFYSVLQGNTRNLVYALEAVRKQKEEAGN